MTFALPPLSLYVHIPWCVKKCPYCDFNSHENTHQGSGLPETEYLAQLKLDLLDDLSFVQGRRLKSIFIGGGTPSLMSAAFYADLLAFISQKISFFISIFPKFLEPHVGHPSSFIILNSFHSF